MSHTTLRNIEPPRQFIDSIMESARAWERRRVVRMYAGFAVLALTPTIARFLWNAIRHDYFSLSTFPMGTTLVKLYSVAMSSAALAVFFVLGIALANRIYLGAWLKAPLPISKPK